jgi:hypothetical protein
MTINVKGANIHILSLLDNKQINEYYSKNKIEWCDFTNVSNINDIQKAKDSDAIFILSEKDIDKKYFDCLNKIGEKWTSKILISTKNLPKLKNICHSTIIQDLDYITINSFLKVLIEAVALPGLTNLDFGDINNFLKNNNVIRLKTYIGKYCEKKETINKIKLDYSTTKNCFFVLVGSKNLKLIDIVDFQKEFSKIFNNVLAAAKIDINMTNSFELYLFTGGKK